MTRSAFAFLALALGAAPAAAQPVSFANKSITVLVGNGAGGGTDIVARLVAPFLGKYLPGAPATLVRNMPGAEGLPASNYFANQTPPDGLMALMESSTSADPMLYRKPQSTYDPTKFAPIGGVGRGGTTLLVNKASEPRLTDKSRTPATMGSLTGVPRSGMLMAAWGIEFLDWNARWILGYPSTPELVAALDRGEIDMTSEGSLHNVQKLVDSGRFRILAQTGVSDNGKVVRRPDFGDAPLFDELMEGRLKTPVERDAYIYWRNQTTIDKWLALAPGTPRPIVDAYRDAFDKTLKDPEFVDRVRKVTEDFTPMNHKDVGALVNALGSISPEAFTFVDSMLKKQGLDAH
jgi:tripartite-type tricarboxylate transporter receptor subunit TctC